MSRVTSNQTVLSDRLRKGPALSFGQCRSVPPLLTQTKAASVGVKIVGISLYEACVTVLFSDSRADAGSSHDHPEGKRLSLLGTHRAWEHLQAHPCILWKARAALYNPPFYLLQERNLGRVHVRPQPTLLTFINCCFPSPCSFLPLRFVSPEESAGLFFMPWCITVTVGQTINVFCFCHFLKYQIPKCHLWD